MLQFSILKKIFKKKKTKKHTLNVTGSGGEITTVNSDTKMPTLNPKKLNNRLSIIVNKIKDLEKKKAPQEEIKQWKKRKEKVRAMLLAFFDIDYNK